MERAAERDSGAIAERQRDEGKVDSLLTRADAAPPRRECKAHRLVRL